MELNSINPKLDTGAAVLDMLLSGDMPETYSAEEIKTYVKNLENPEYGETGHYSVFDKRTNFTMSFNSKKEAQFFRMLLRYVNLELDGKRDPEAKKRLKLVLQSILIEEPDEREQQEAEIVSPELSEGK